MKTEILSERVHNHLRSRLFPWNFLIEPVDDAAIERFIQKDFMIPPKIMEENLSKEELSDIICDEVKKIANEFFTLKGKLDPFAYAQALVYTILYDLKSRRELSGLSDIVDIKAIARLTGISMDSFERKEESILQLILRHKGGKKSAKKIFGKKVTYADGTPIGNVHDIVYDARTGDMLEMKIKKDEELFTVPIDEIFLKNVYNNCVILKDVNSYI